MACWVTGHRIVGTKCQQATRGVWETHGPALCRNLDPALSSRHTIPVHRQTPGQTPSQGLVFLPLPARKPVSPLGRAWCPGRALPQLPFAVPGCRPLSALYPLLGFLDGLCSAAPAEPGLGGPEAAATGGIAIQECCERRQPGPPPRWAVVHHARWRRRLPRKAGGRSERREPWGAAGPWGRPGVVFRRGAVRGALPCAPCLPAGRPACGRGYPRSRRRPARPGSTLSWRAPSRTPGRVCGGARRVAEQRFRAALALAAGRESLRWGCSPASALARPACARPAGAAASPLRPSGPGADGGAESSPRSPRGRPPGAKEPLPRREDLNSRLGGLPGQRGVCSSWESSRLGGPRAAPGRGAAWRWCWSPRRLWA